MGNVGPVSVKFREKGNELIVASVFTIVLRYEKIKSNKRKWLEAWVRKRQDYLYMQMW